MERKLAECEHMDSTLSESAHKNRTQTDSIQPDGTQTNSTQPEHELVVSRAGGNFDSVQAAVDSIPEHAPYRTVITVRQGTYTEKLRINKPNLHLRGEGEVVFRYDDYAAKPGEDGNPVGTYGSASTYITGDNVKVENITFVNSAGPSERVAQAVALYVDADRVAFYGCTFIGEQDTLYLGRPKEQENNRTARNYFAGCTIIGDIDFIFGSATAWFEDCTIISLDKGKEINGYITAAATPVDKRTGFVFRNCLLTGEAGPDSVYLGRPWRDYAKTVFIDCEMGGHIRREGWHDWDKASAWTTVRYGEAGSHGPGANDAGRTAWSRRMSEKELEAYTLEACFDGDTSWIF
ncbi:pectinesterase family protein [Paenibacillus sp. CN-4]|uniref:pectinesterase family protein n=1 Tax=Paenibacillus nanchangensis TaxID=3348343 RepID=UPI00397C59E2